jgi:hypothetical protein
MQETAVSNGGFDQRDFGDRDDTSASIAGIDHRPSHLRCPRWRHVVVSVRYCRRRWPRRICDWQHGQRWGGTDAARDWNTLETPKTPSEPSCERSAGPETPLGARDRPNRRRALVYRSALSIETTARKWRSSICMAHLTAPFEGRGHAPW